MKVTFTLLLVAIFFVVKPLLVDAQKVYTSDSLALVDLYNSTDGSNWLNHSGWLIRGPVSTCYGVTLENDGDFERVVNINLQLTLVSDTVTITDAYLPVTLINFIGQLTHNNGAG